MIKAEFLVFDSGQITGFNISGHANYSEQGYDIVCASVSSAAYMTANTITDVLGVSAEVSVDEKRGSMTMILEEKSVAVCRDILTGFKKHMMLLEEIYPKNIKVSYTEVQ